MDEDKPLPELPGFHTLSRIFSGVSTFILMAGVVTLLFVFLFDQVRPEIGFLAAVSPGLFLFVCGILAEPCIVGLRYASEDVRKYFSPPKEEKPKYGSYYDPGSMVVHLVVCGIIASLLLVAMPNTENWIFDYVFALMYTIAVTCFVILTYFKKYVTV